MKFKKFSFLTISFYVLLILVAAGCSRKEGPERVVAKINDYTMTADDFNYESKEVLRTGRLLGEVPVTKEDVLDALITKEILLQEAQREGLDKEKDFMKTIELYWEQTLLKKLLIEKSKEIGKRAAVYENEISDCYEKMKDKIRAQVLVFGDERTARKLLNYSGDVVEYMTAKQDAFQLLYTIPSKWYILGEDNTPLEASVFNVDPARNRELANINGKWALILVEERAPNEVAPLSSVKDAIAKRIKAKKERELMNEWIDGLRSKARIRINKNVLEELQ